MTDTARLQRRGASDTEASRPPILGGLLLHSGERIKSVRHLDILDLLEDGLAIHAEGLIKRFGSTVALNGLDLQVQAGSIFALLGPNGAGKTPAVRIFTTLLKPHVGRAWVAGFDVVGDANRLKASIGLAGQEVAIDEYLTGRENLEMIGRLYRRSARDGRHCAPTG
jgi:ABC-type polysaccharide/polyol phosphate transport system ATPase subunit